MNPARSCGFCRHIGNETLPGPQLVLILGDGSDREFKALCDTVDNCPACILAAIRQADVWGKLADEVIAERETGQSRRQLSEEVIWFDFKAKAKEFWREERESQAEFQRQKSEEIARGLREPSTGSDQIPFYQMPCYNEEDNIPW